MVSSSSSGSPPVNGSTVLSHSVSIQRVWTLKPFAVADEGGIGHHGAVERDDRGQALDVELGQRAARPVQRLVAGGAGDDQLGQHRVELAADDRAGLDAGVQAHARAGRRVELGDRARGGQEAAAGVLAVDAELEGVTARRRVLGDVEGLAVGDAELLAHQVDARGLLGDRVFDLQAGVDLEERDQAVLADQVLDGARAVVAGLLADALGGLVDLLALRVGEERRGRLLDQLLEAALQRAVAGARDDDVAVRVGDDLRLDVARLVQVALDEALAATERRRRPRGWPSRTARGSPRWCGRPSCRGRRRRRRP